MRRLVTLVVSGLLVGLAACGDDGGTTGPGAAAVEPGLIVGRATEDGDLLDRLLVVDPQRPGDQQIDFEGADRGVPAGPGRALYETDTGIALVDVEAGEVTDLGLPPGRLDLGYSRSAVTGGDDRVVVLLSPTGDAGALVDLESGTTTDLLDVVPGADAAFGAEVAPDGSVVLLNTGEGVHLVPTDAPEEARRIGDGAGQLVDGGSSVLLTSVDGVVIRAVDAADDDGDDTVVVAEGGSGALAVGDRVLVARGDEAVLVEPGSDDALVAAPFGQGGSAPVAVGETVLLPAPDGSTWTLLDGAEATTTSLEELAGLTPAFSGRPARWVPFTDAPPGGERLAAVDTADGSVQVADLPPGATFGGLPVLADAGSAALVSVSGDDGLSTYLVELDSGAAALLGERLQGATFSPDGRQVAWSSGAGAELHVAPVDDPAAAEVVAEGIALPVWVAA